jgi:IMP dehydrogenase/GMP reductase
MSDDVFLSYDDVLIIPGFSDVNSRQDCDTSVLLAGSGGIFLNLPIIAANMDTVCEAEMCKAMYKHGGIGVLHRNLTVRQRRDQFLDVAEFGWCGIALGINELPLQIARYFLLEGASMIVVDVAHGHSKRVQSVVEGLRGLIDKNGYECTLVAGNVATADGAKFLAEAGADMVKVGIGPGAACTTRLQTGVGVPQLSAVMDCADAMSDYVGVQIIADGGIKHFGDVAKALAAGADVVMLGGMLASCVESPGQTKEVDGVKLKQFRGMASAAAGSKYVEGADGWVVCDTDVNSVMTSISNGLQSAMSYVGARKLHEFKENAQFLQVSSLSMKENGAHAYS